LKELDMLIADFAEYNEQLLPTKERFSAWLENQGFNPEECYTEKLKRIRKKD
jgi:hypothetical protein